MWSRRSRRRRVPIRSGRPGTKRGDGPWRDRRFLDRVSSHLIEPEMSSAMTMSTPFDDPVVREEPACGRASATTASTMAPPLSHGSAFSIRTHGLLGRPARPWASGKAIRGPPERNRRINSQITPPARGRSRSAQGVAKRVIARPPRRVPPLPSRRVSSFRRAGRPLRPRRGNRRGRRRGART